jgi:hypothetical protein
LTAWACSSRFWRKHLEITNFGSGCPVLAVCLEEASNMQGVAPGDQEAAEQARLLGYRQLGIFDDWRSIIAKALQREGVSPGRAETSGNAFRCGR